MEGSASVGLRPLFGSLTTLADETVTEVLLSLGDADAWTGAGVLLHEVARRDTRRARRIGAELVSRRADSWQAYLFDPVPVTEDELAAALVRLGPGAGRPWQHAVDLWHAGDLDGAEHGLRELVRRSRPDIRAAAAVAHAVLLRDQRGDLAAAQRLLEFATADAEPGVRALAQLHLGACHDAAGQLEPALAAYATAMQTGEPRCAAEAALQLGWILTDAGSDSEARRVFEAGLAHDDPATAAWLQLALGQLELRAERPRRALSHWAKAAKATEPLAVGYSLWLRAQQYRSQGDDNKAGALIDRLIQTPGTEELWPFALEADLDLANDIDTRIEMMAQWLTWLAATRATSVAFYDRARVTARLVATFDGAGTALFAGLPHQRRLGGRRLAALRAFLESQGFQEIDEGPDDQPAEIAEWMARRPVPNGDPFALARACETVLGHGYGLPSDFYLGTRWSSEVPLEPLPRPLLPQLLP
jgi:hypothetical protein